MSRYKGRHSTTAKTLSANRLRKLLNYDPATGLFRWRTIRNNRVNAGDVAGCISRPKGLRVICIDTKLYQANRLAWLYMTGKWPKLEINYINRNTSDTRWVNLREMTPSQRSAGARTTNKSGIKGVSATKSGKYLASIKVAGKKRYLGVFDTSEKAGAAYARAAKRVFGQFARAR
jgi:HNH endonuclease